MSQLMLGLQMLFSLSSAVAKYVRLLFVGRTIGNANRNEIKSSMHAAEQ